MRVGKFLKRVFALFVSLIVIRAAFGAGGISITDMLVDLQQFNFNFDEIRVIIRYYTSGQFAASIPSWNSNITSISTFFLYVASLINALMHIFTFAVYNFWRGIWLILKFFFGVFLFFINVCFKWTGIA